MGVVPKMDCMCKKKTGINPFCTVMDERTVKTKEYVYLCLSETHTERMRSGALGK